MCSVCDHSKPYCLNGAATFLCESRWVIQVTGLFTVSRLLQGFAPHLQQQLAPCSCSVAALVATFSMYRLKRYFPALPALHAHLHRLATLPNHKQVAVGALVEVSVHEALQPQATVEVPLSLHTRKTRT